MRCSESEVQCSDSEGQGVQGRAGQGRTGRTKGRQSTDTEKTGRHNSAEKNGIGDDPRAREDRGEPYRESQQVGTLRPCGAAVISTALRPGSEPTVGVP